MFAAWVLLYLGRAAAPPPAPPSLADMLDDIDYPSWEDILTADEETVEEQMKDPPKAVELPAVESPTVEPFVDRSNKVNDPIVDRSSKTSEPIVDRSSKAGEPIVDRSSKAAAAALYARALARQQQLAEAALAAERARLAAEQDWPAVRAAADTLREQEILSQLLQLESKQHDMEQENRELRARLEQYLRQDAARVDDELARRQTAIQEAAEQRAQLHERAQELELARVRRQQEEPTEPVPTVDRATKPPPDAPWWQRSLEGEPGDVPPGHTGLRNLGNSCYLNACVQCLSHTPGLASAFADKDFYKQIDRGARSSGSLVVELALVVRALWSGQWRWLAPWELRTAVGQALPMFRGGGQHDCHELLTLMLDRLDQQLTAPIGHKSNVLHSLYTGSTASTVRCARCQHASVSEESFTSLSLELGEATSRCSLTDCLRRHAQHESLAGWRCDKCHVAAGATKRLALALPPRALVLHLKRFHIQPAEGGPRTVKRQTLVTFPLRGLDARLLGASSRVLYHLYAVANHYGSSGSGHYTAVVRAGQQWLMLDDHAVRAVPPEDVVSSAAYLLFYERSDRE